MPILPLLVAVALAASIACSDGDEREDPTTETDAATETPETFDDQVELGAMLFGEYCAECHGNAGQGTDRAPRLVGLDEGALPLDPPESRMKRTERFVTVADVASFVVENMPPDDPGGLSTEEYLAVLAFDLDANGITLDEKLDLDVAETLTIPR